MKRNTKIVMSLVVSLVLTLLTLFIPISVQTREEMTAVKHGFPLSFVSQDISMLDWGRGAESPTLPQKTGLLSPQNYPFEFHLGTFVLDVIFWTIFIYFLFYFGVMLK